MDNLELIKDTKVEMRVVLGKTKMQLRDVLRLGEGSLISLDKYHNEPVEIYIGNKLFAKGVVVSVDDNYGVKITEIKNYNESVKNQE